MYSMHFKRNVVLASILFFCFGCSLTSYYCDKIDCPHAKETDAYKTSSSLNRVEYVIFVITGPENEDKRSTIRQTWANLVNNVNEDSRIKFYEWDYIRFYFVVGTLGLQQSVIFSLANENKLYGDMLLLNNLEDSYENLSIKMLHSLKWANDNFKRLKYLIKCDDDSFVRIDLIIKELQRFAPKMNDQTIKQYMSYQAELPFYKGLYWGYFTGNAGVFKSGKWKETNWFLCDKYLPYAVGGAFVISHSIVDYIGKNYDVLSSYKSEDVSMGVWTAALKDINRVHDIRFDTEWRSRGCLNSMLVRHKQGKTDMLAMYENLTSSRGLTLCSSEKALSPYHIYNWSKKPSMCCRKESLARGTA